MKNRVVANVAAVINPTGDLNDFLSRRFKKRLLPSSEIAVAISGQNKDPASGESRSTISPGAGPAPLRLLSPYGHCMWIDNTEKSVAENEKCRGCGLRAGAGFRAIHGVDGFFNRPMKRHDPRDV